MLIALLLLGLISSGMTAVCSQCDSDLDPECMYDPPPARNCTSCRLPNNRTGACDLYVHMSYCAVERRYLNGTLVRVTRDCIPALMRHECDDMIDGGQLYNVCFFTCKSDGCNSGAAPPRWTPVQGLITGAITLLHVATVASIYN